MILDEGMTELIDQFPALISNAQCGTATTLPLKTDTGLTSAVSATLLAPTSTISGNTVKFLHTVGTAVANGTSLSEHELRFASNDSLNRNLLGDVNKTASYILVTTYEISFIRG